MTALKIKEKSSSHVRVVETEADRLSKLQSAAADVARRHREGKIDAETAAAELAELARPKGGFLTWIFG